MIDKQDSPGFSKALLLFSLFILPIIIYPILSLNFDDIFLNIKAIWAVFVILPSSLYMIVLYKGRIDKITLSIIFVLIFLIIFGNVINLTGWTSIIGAPSRLQSIPIYISYVIATLATYLWLQKDPEAGSLFVSILSWLAVPLGVYVILQYYGFAGIVSGEATGGVAATISGATLGNRGYLAGCMALLLPIAATAALRSSWKLVFVFLIGFSLTASLTRGCLLAAACGYLVWIMQGNFKYFYVHLVLFLGLIAPLPHLTASQSDLRNFDSDHGGQAVSDASGRLPLWNTALYGIQLHPMFGWGTGQLLNVMARRPDAQLLAELNVPLVGRTAKRMPRRQDGVLRWRITQGGAKAELVTEPTNAVHNEYLEYALAYGIPAALSFMALFLLGAVRSLGHLPWAAASIFAYLIYLLTWPETVRFAPLAWAILGLALASRSMKAQKGKVSNL